MYAATRNVAIKYGQKLSNVTTQAAVVGLSLVPFAARAADGDDPGLTAITALSGKATLYIAAAFAVAVLVASGFWGITFMKKSFGKAK